jgi:hypothetical protein
VAIGEPRHRARLLREQSMCLKDSDGQLRQTNALWQNWIRSRLFLLLFSVVLGHLNRGAIRMD